MTEKQYKLEQWTSSSLYYSFPDGNLHNGIGKVIARVENDLNSLYNENEQLKQREKTLEGMIRTFDEGCKEIYDDKCRLEKENERLKGEVAHYKLVLMHLEEQAKRISSIRRG